MNGIHWLKYRRTRTEAFFCFSLTSAAFGALNYVLENELGRQLLFSCYFCSIIHFFQSYYIEYQCRHKFTRYFFSVYWSFSLYSLAIHLCLTVLLVLLYYYRELLSSIVSVCSERNMVVYCEREKGKRTSSISFFVLYLEGCAKDFSSSIHCWKIVYVFSYRFVPKSFLTSYRFTTCRMVK